MSGREIPVGDGLTLRAYDNYDELISRSSRPDRLTIVSLAQRAGVRRYAVRLEHEYFKPLTELNKDYELEYVKWQDILWMVIMVPLASLPVCEQLADACALRLANGAPCVNVTHLFPAHHDRVRTIENIADSRVYSGGYDQLVREEQQWLDSFFKHLRHQGE